MLPRNFAIEFAGCSERVAKLSAQVADTADQLAELETAGRNTTAEFANQLEKFGRLQAAFAANAERTAELAKQWATEIRAEL